MAQTLSQKASELSDPNNQLFMTASQGCIYSYDGGGYMTGAFNCKAPDVAGSSVTYSIEFIYNAKGQLVQGTRTLSNGTTHVRAFAYDPLGRMVRKLDELGNVLEEMHYGLAPFPMSVTQNGVTYDLVYATANWWQVSETGAVTLSSRPAHQQSVVDRRVSGVVSHDASVRLVLLQHCRTANPEVI